MNRLFAVILVGVLCVSLVSCDTKSKDNHLVSLHNQETDEALALGMSKDGVEELLGSGSPEIPIYGEDTMTSEEPYATVRYGTGTNEIRVIYENNLAVVGLVISPYVTSELDYVSDWRLPNEITCGSSLEEMFTQYGEQEESGAFAQGESEDPALKDIQLYRYYFDDAGLVEEPQEDSSYLVFVVNGQNRKIYAIALYAMDPQTVSYMAPLSQ